MTTATQPTFTVTEAPDRISAVGVDGTEICGAFREDGQEHWQLFVTSQTGLRIPTRHRRLSGGSARDASRAWVHVIANHHTKGSA